MLMIKGFDNGFPHLNRRRTGQRIQAYMQLRGLSVEDVRRSLLLESPQSIYHWLEGKSMLSVDNLYAPGLLLRVPVDYLLCGEQRRPGAPGSNDEARVRRLGYYLDAFEATEQSTEMALH